jgi:hypothetical protein
MTVKTKEVHIHAFSISGYILPTFQRATVETHYYFGIKIKRFVTFDYFKTEKDILLSNYTKTKIRVKAF